MDRAEDGLLEWEMGGAYVEEVELPLGTVRLKSGVSDSSTVLDVSGSAQGSPSEASVKKTYSYKGIEYTFIDTVPEDLVCPVCRELLDEAQQTACGHLFCKKCLRNIRRGKRLSCPVCRTEHFCKGSESMNDKYNERRVTNLRVKCPKIQCKWNGTLGKADDHKRCQCLFENVPCSKGCGTLVLRRNLQSHRVNDCRLRSFVCKFCHQEGAHEFITTDHCRECAKYPIECPNQCGEKIAQINIESHLHECPLQDTECRYSVFGCTTVIKRSETTEHETQQKDYHLDLSLKKMLLLFQTVSDMYSVVQSLSHRLSAAECQPRQYHTLLSRQEPVHLPPNPLESFTQPRRPWLENRTLFPSSPWIFKINDFERHRRERKVLYWKLFSHPAGYKFVIRAEVKYNYDVNDYISASYFTEDGPNDSTLKWPFHGRVTVTLLNQVEDRYHHTRTISFREEIEHASNELQGESKVDRGVYVQQRLPVNCQFLKDDCLFFSITISNFDSCAATTLVKKECVVVSCYD